MVALKTERRVFLWRVTPQVTPSDVLVDVNLSEIVKILEDQTALKAARVYLKDSRILEDDDPDRDEEIRYILRKLEVIRTPKLSRYC